MRMSKRVIMSVILALVGVCLAACDEALPASAEQPPPTSAGIVIDDEPVTTPTTGRPGGANVQVSTVEATSETDAATIEPTAESTTEPATIIEETPEVTPESTTELEPTAEPTPIEVDTIQQGRTIATYDSAVLSLAFSPDGRWLATGGEDTTVHIWDITTGEALIELDDPEAWVTGVDFSNDGQWFAAATDDGQIRWWVFDTITDIRPRLRRSDIHVGTIVGSIFSPIVPEMMISVDANSGVLYVWNTVTYIAEATLETGIRPFAVALHPTDEALVAIAGADSTGAIVQVWDVLFLDPVTHWSLDSLPLSIAYHPDGERIAIGADTAVTIWQVRNPTEPLLTIATAHSVRVVAFSPDGTQLAFATGDRVQFIDLDSGNIVSEITNNGSEIFTFAYSPDGTQLATGDSDGLVRLWQVDDQ